MFRDRKDAALKLAAALEKYKGEDVLVLGVPRGGAETGYYVARQLEAAFSLLIARKLGFPYNPELAIGAVAEDGSVYLQDGSLPAETIGAMIVETKKEIERRVRELRGGKPLPEIKGRTVIVVDDGIATGSTLLAAIQLCRNWNAGKVIVAAPVAAQEAMWELRKEADEVVVLEEPEEFYAVGEFYGTFENLSDQEARAFLERWERERAAV